MYDLNWVVTSEKVSASASATRMLDADKCDTDNLFNDKCDADNLKCMILTELLLRKN